ncbi:cytochrome-c oxidase, cbb3-type subunit III [Thiolapillus brandeum]|uniref:Cbb3-type cytochrome c oxidase subunit n=1 Tax=Thiolapillus brandeum TaxID=1076588 RepID=A0A7U6GJ05_9GAMM|nr:cytochrome-c oxidase, cbb3-type subunit III [Thiolapillus brandeum]BAO44583.1 cb-type cytochrome c oxidase subunit III [Thiolapillus brandeum]
MSEDKNRYGQTTGHVWDETLAELTNPPPKWWMLGLHASWILVVLYTLYYPSWPLVHSHFKGFAGWTAIGEFKKDMKEVQDVRAKYEDKLPGMSAAAILADNELKNYVVRSAKVLFGDNCAACHGSGGAGNPGFPALVDDDWLYGGTIDNIQQTITNGRKGMMPKMGGNQLTDEEIDKLANAIVGGTITKEPLFAAKGCIGCHGPDGKGMAALGSANLTDKIWRFKAQDQLASVKTTIKHGVNDPSDPNTRKAEMPSWKDRLTDTQIKKLAVYVHEFGGGK